MPNLAPSTRRIACIRWTELPIVAHLHRLPGTPDPVWSTSTVARQLTLDLPEVQAPPTTEPLPRALLASDAPTSKIVAVDGRASQAGIQIGMTLARARARAPSLTVTVFDPSRLVPFEAKILEKFLTISPRLGRGSSLLAFTQTAPDTLIGAFEYFVEVERLRELDQLAEVVRDLDCGPVAIGVADGAFAALCAARTVEATVPPVDGQPRRRVIARRGDVEFLARLSSSFLPTTPEVHQTLVSLGLNTLGEVAKLPLEGIQARLGEHGRSLVQLARGVAPPLLATHVPEADPAVLIDLEAWALREASVDSPSMPATAPTDTSPLLFALRAACGRLLPLLHARGRGPSELALVLEGRSTLRLSIHPARPDVDHHALFELMRATLDGALRRQAREDEDLDGISADLSEVKRLRLIATQLVPIRPEGERLAFHRRETPFLPLEVALARLGSRFGQERVVTPIRKEDPRPHARGVFVPATTQRVAEQSESPPPLPTFRERLRTPCAALGMVMLSRLPRVGDSWPLTNQPHRDRATRTVREITPAERVTGLWWTEGQVTQTYRWAISNDGIHALFARRENPEAPAPEEHTTGHWQLMGIAD